MVAIDPNRYYTIMNAQNGLIYGARPYRLKGSFESAIKVLTGKEALVYLPII